MCITISRNICVYVFVTFFIKNSITRSTPPKLSVDQDSETMSDMSTDNYHDTIHMHHEAKRTGQMEHLSSSHVIVNTENPNRKHLTTPIPTLYFSLTSEHTMQALKNSDIASATLKLSMRGDKHCHNSNDCTVIICVYQTHKNRSKEHRILLNSQTVSLNKARLVSFDISKAVEQWLSDSSNNHGLVLHSDSPLDLHSVLNIPNVQRTTSTIPKSRRESFTNFKPVLHLGLKHRVKRSIEIHDCASNNQEHRCCRYPIWIRFSDIGWDDWVVAPDGYQGYYCSGSCPYNYKVATNFASIQWLLNGASEGQIPTTHCSPTRHSHINVLHYNERGELVMRRKSNMIVDRCACL